MEAIPSPLMNEKEAADWLGLSVRWMQEKRVTGDGPPFVRISSRAVRYRVDDLDRWARERVRRSTSDVAARAA